MRIEGMDANLFNSQITRNDNIALMKDARPALKEAATEIRDKAVGRKHAQPPEHEKQQELTISEQAVSDAVEKVNRALAGSHRRLEISVHEKTKGIMVKVVDSDTEEVIREVPPEKILDLVAKLWEMAGLIVDERR